MEEVVRNGNLTERESSSARIFFPASLLLPLLSRAARLTAPGYTVLIA